MVRRRAPARGARGHGPPGRPLPPVATATLEVGMFERFTNRARRVVVYAQEECVLLRHDHIGTEHLLLGLLHEGEGVAARALGSLGVSLQAARAQVGEVAGRGRRPPGGHIPFTGPAKRVLEHSLREAR